MLRVHIANLRRKLEPEAGKPRYITDRPGRRLPLRHALTTICIRALHGLNARLTRGARLASRLWEWTSSRWPSRWSFFAAMHALVKLLERV